MAFKFVYARGVGGDKDGHSGVNEKIMLRVMNIARHHFIHYIKDKLTDIHDAIELIAKENPVLKKQVSDCSKNLKAIQKIHANDAAGIAAFRQALEKLKLNYEQSIHDVHPALEDLLTLFALFPGLIIPLELREDATLIQQALQEDCVINKMLATIADISKGYDPNIYAKGLIISMCQSQDDIMAAITLTKRYFTEKMFRVTPLFENRGGTHTST